MNTVNTNCPLCDNSNVEEIRKFEIGDCLRHLSIYSADLNYRALYNKIHYLWNQDTSYFLECKNCRLSFASPFISGDQEFYTLVYDEAEYSSDWKWDFKITFNKLVDLIKVNEFENSTLLEIGAGDGIFVERVSNSLISPVNIVTTEFSDYGRKKIHELQITSLPCHLRDLLTEKYIGSFNFICMFQVLEHLDNLDDVFNSLKMLLNKSGHLFITVPNHIHRLEFEKSGIFEDIPPMHLSRWSLDSFRFIEQKYDLRIIEYQVEAGSRIYNLLKYLTLQFEKCQERKQVQKRKNYQFPRLLKYITYFVLSIKFLKPLFLISIKKDMGISQWVHFVKNEV